jgi:hypothetical protein
MHKIMFFENGKCAIEIDNPLSANGKLKSIINWPFLFNALAKTPGDFGEKVNRNSGLALVKIESVELNYIEQDVFCLSIKFLKILQPTAHSYLIVKSQHFFFIIFYFRIKYFTGFVFFHVFLLLPVIVHWAECSFIDFSAL